MNRRMDRRDCLKVGWLAALGPIFARQAGLPGGRLLGTLPLGGQGAQPAPPFGHLLGSGLDARLFTDLSTLTPDTLVTPADRFFIRTTCPPRVSGASWRIELGGLVGTPRTVPVDSLGDLVRPMGTHVIECAGNANPTN